MKEEHRKLLIKAWFLELLEDLNIIPERHVPFTSLGGPRKSIEEALKERRSIDFLREYLFIEDFTCPDILEYIEWDKVNGRYISYFEARAIYNTLKKIKENLAKD